VPTAGALLDCYAVTTPRLEALAAAELSGLGLVPGATEPGGVPFRAGPAGLYAANLHLRTVSRVLVRVAGFHADAFHELERHARRVPWERYAAAGGAVEFRVTSRKSRLYHQRAVAERLARAVAERVPGAVAGAGEGEGEEGGAAQLFVVRVAHDRCVVSADSSGELLHRRGYRLAGAKAPLRETLAAAMLLAAEWDPQAPLLDPFCGAGTIPIEAALLARRIPPGLGRGFAFERWAGFEPATWERVVADARARVLDRAPAPILGSDRDAGAVAAAAANAERAGVAGDVGLRRGALSAVEPPPGAGWLVTNPPYGVRVGERLRLRDLFARLGRVARERLPGWRVALLSAHAELERQVGLPFETRLATTNGGIRVRLVRAAVPAAPAASASGRAVG
jgi:putative N6-adenine-specific DNA methylase